MVGMVGMVGWALVRLHPQSCQKTAKLRFKTRNLSGKELSLVDLEFYRVGKRGNPLQLYYLYPGTCKYPQMFEKMMFVLKCV
jgi:hypothetical protein